MPINFTIYPLGRLVRYTVEGTATPDDARGFLDAVLAHRRFQRGFMFLGDRRWATEPDAAYVRTMDQEIRARLALLRPVAGRSSFPRRMRSPRSGRGASYFREAVLRSSRS